MKLTFCTCVVACALSTVAPALAAPAFTPFLSVDVDAYNAGGGQTLGPTAAGFQGWEMAEGLFLDPSIDWGNSGAAGLTKVFSSSQGNITANLIGVVPNAFRGARNRGANADALSDVTSDFVFAQRDNAVGFGRHYVKLTLSGLQPNTGYEMTLFARDHFNGGADSFQAWTDVNRLAGLDGPSAWMDANVAADASYQPAAGGTLNPIPTAARSPVSGPAGILGYEYSASFAVTSSAGGVVTVYGWADPNTFSGVQGSSLLNGFQVGLIPEPGALSLAIVGLGGLAAVRRKSR